MPHTALRRTSGVALTAALVAATPAANMPRASAADTPSLRVLTYNGVWWSGCACASTGSDFFGPGSLIPVTRLRNFFGARPAWPHIENFNRFRLPRLRIGPGKDVGEAPVLRTISTNTSPRRRRQRKLGRAREWL
ncbi:hypothetical protein ACFYWN_40130 [Streptomyces sp. NPDC002917]|uniref:hypothetical protein n=1 Tax=Streptomyces sp. NPDC002917 TaxID=3364671 RepID=UPI0036C437DD